MKSLPESYGCNSPIISVIDAMAFIQRQQTLGCKTFGELQSSYRKKVVDQRPKGCRVIHFVGDRYDFDSTQSLKEETRLKRTSGLTE